MKGSLILKILGVLLIIGGMITVITGASGFNSAKDLSNEINLLNDFDISRYKTIVYISMVGGLVQAISGMLCIINSKNPEKSMMLIVCAIVIAAFSTMGNIISTSLGFESIRSLVYGLLVPALIVLGTTLNKR